MRLSLPFFKLILSAILVVAASRGQATVSFCAVGDVMLDRNVRRHIEENNDVHYPMALAKPYIQGHDLAFCNVESSISARGKRVKGLWRFRGDPAFVPMLSEGGFNIASVANNHTLDWGREAFVDTMEILKTGGLTVVGGGMNQAEAIAPVYVEKNGVKFAFIGNETVPLDGFTDRPEHKRLPGPAQATIESIEASVRKARHNADIVIVSQHWGIEYEDQPRQYQVAQARRIIDAGANLLIGHHPHVLQPIEHYHGGVIVYSLGNFIFDQFRPRQTQTLIFKCEFTRQGIKDPRIVPMRVTPNFRPGPVETDDAAYILDWMERISQPFGTQWSRSGTALAFVTAPAVQYHAVLPQGAITVDSRGVRWAAPGQAALYWDAPAGMALTHGVGRPDGEDGYRLYSVLSPNNRPQAGQVAVFKLANGRLSEPTLMEQKLSIWKLAMADVDDNGFVELCVGVQGAQGNRYLKLYSDYKGKLVPKPMGAAPGINIADFYYQRLEGSTAMVVTEQPIAGVQRTLTYKWDGTGFTEREAD